jgi:hypothetical protein
MVTDAGALLLVSCQHVCLCVGSLLFVRSLTSDPRRRLAAALGFALSAPIYVTCHTVGNEAPAVVLTVFALGLAFSLLRQLQRGENLRWAGLCAALTLGILARHAQLILVVAVPLVVAALLSIQVVSKRRCPLQRPAIASARGLAIACGFSVLVLAGAEAAKAVCRKWAGLPNVSTSGLTFLSRLEYLEGVDVAARRRLLSDAANRAGSPEARILLTSYETDALASGETLPGIARGFPPWSAGRHFVVAIVKLEPSWRSGDPFGFVPRRAFEALLALRQAVLVLPDPSLREAILRDIGLGLRVSPRDLAIGPVLGTAVLERERPRVEALGCDMSHLGPLSAGPLPRWLGVWAPRIPLWTFFLAPFVVLLARYRLGAARPTAEAVALSAVLAVTALGVLIASSTFARMVPRYALSPFVLLLGASLAALLSDGVPISAAQPPGAGGRSGPGGDGMAV